MCANPESLKDLCLNYLCHNIEKMYKAEETCENDSESECVFINKNVFLPKELSEELLTKLSVYDKLNDEILSLFSNKNVYLRNVILPKAKNMTIKGLRTLRRHKVKKLKIAGLDCTANELVDSLGERTAQDLESLCVSDSLFPNDSTTFTFYFVASISKFQNLRFLNVSNTEFTTNHLNTVVVVLPHLESLDISNTYVDTLAPLEKIKNQLLELRVYNLKNIAMNVIDFSPLKCMTSLTHLDISTEMCCFPFKSFGCETPRLQRLLHPDWLPNLVSLDLSGNCEVGPRVIQDFLTTHTKLRFLGLMRMEDCGLTMFTDPSHPLYRSDLIVTGFKTKEQLLAGLNCYPQRPTYMHENLFYLYKLIVQDGSSKEDLIELILYVMNCLSDSYMVHVEGTACLKEMTSNCLISKIHPSVWSKVVEVILGVMERFRYHYKIQNNILLMLCNDRILLDDKMDLFKCAELTIGTFGLFYDINIEFMSITVCRKLVENMTTSEIFQLGSNQQYISKLLFILIGKIIYRLLDPTLDITLSVLWKLTDVSPITCKLFIDNGGLIIYKDLLNIFMFINSIEMKILVVMIKIAEIPYLRPTLIHHDIICNLRRLLRPDQCDIRSYLAAGLLAYLACEPGWEIYTNNDKAEVLEQLRYTVKHWVPPEEEIVPYSSFQPLIGLLNSTDKPQVQLWAAWAILHVCTINANKYCEMLKQENGMVILQNIASDVLVDHEVFSLCYRILDLIK